MKVSIIMPVYNAEKYVFDAIDSILKQTFTNFELLIFNDGSKDKSLEIIKSFNDERIKLHNFETNVGYVQHLNSGLKIAKGEYIARMDADDISMPTRLEEQVNFMDNHQDFDLCGTMTSIIDSKSELINNPTTYNEIYADMFWRNPYIHSSIMFRKSILEKFNLKYEIDYRPSEDYLLFSKITLFSKTINIDKVLVSYRFHENQVSNTESDMSFFNAQRVRIYLLEEFLQEKLTEREKVIFNHIMKEFNSSIGPNELISFFKKIKNSKKEIDLNLKNLIIDRFKKAERREIRRYFLWETDKLKRKKSYIKYLFNHEIGCHFSFKEKISSMKKLLL